MDAPKVSVIIPAYNAGGFIRDALDSVRAQTFQNLEVIVVDDGSVDDTFEIVTREYPWVRCLRIANGGAGRARNVGIRESRGEFVAFLDADDVWVPHKLERQVALMDKNRALGLTFTEATVRDANGVWIPGLQKRQRLMAKGDIVRNIFSRSYLGTSTVMVRRAVLDEVGYFEEELVCAEDDNLWMRLALKAPIDLIDEPLTRAHTQPNSLSMVRGNVFTGVKAHLALLETKYPELRARLGPLVPEKHSALHLEHGIEWFSLNDQHRARTEFAAALRYRRAHPLAMLYWLATFLPVSLYPVLRKLNRAVRRFLPRRIAV